MIPAARGRSVDASLSVGGSAIPPLHEDEADGERVRLGPQLRAVLAVLLLEAGQVVPRSRLAELLWGEPIPDGAATTLRSHILHLRRALAPKHPGQEQRAVIVTEASSYGLRFLPEQLDATRFERLAEAGRRLLAAGDPGAAGNQLRRALDLWRGPALTDLADRPFAVRAATRLEELRMTALEARFEADLALGRHHQVTGEIEALVRLHPVRERLRGQLMLALYRSGRQAEALAAYRAARTTLVKEFGIEPSAGLQRLEHAILTQDPALEPMRPPQLVADLPDQGPPSGLASAGPDARSGAIPSDQGGTRDPRRARRPSFPGPPSDRGCHRGSARAARRRGGAASHRRSAPNLRATARSHPGRRDPGLRGDRARHGQDHQLQPGEHGSAERSQRASTRVERTGIAQSGQSRPHSDGRAVGWPRS